MPYQGTWGILLLWFKEIATRIQMKYPQSKWEAALQEAKEDMAKKWRMFVWLLKSYKGIFFGEATVLPGPHLVLRGQESWV